MPRRADEDELHRMGFRDCAREAVRFLTEDAQLDPESDVVQRIRGLLDGPTTTSHHRIVGSTADSGVSSDADNLRRVRRTTRTVEDGKNRSVTTRRCLHEGNISRRQRHRGRPRRIHARTAVVNDPPITSPTLPDFVASTDRTEHSTATVGDNSRWRYPLRTLQMVPVSNNSTSTSTGCDQLIRDVDVTTAADVVECASMLVNLSQTDARVHSAVTELLQLMDFE